MQSVFSPELEDSKTNLGGLLARLAGTQNMMRMRSTVKTADPEPDTDHEEAESGRR
jgi:hypothetical protein